MDGLGSGWDDFIADWVGFGFRQGTLIFGLDMSWPPN